MQENNIISGSFRDPNGFLFLEGGILYRNICNTYKENYDLLMNSGLYDKLVKENLLIPHTETEKNTNFDFDVYKTIKPELVNFISYPYEWSFSQLKNSALTTLKIQKLALDFGMTLKDASSYNIQFKNGKPIFIDTLSFEKYTEGEPWIAYKQLCKHFLAPLSLMSYKNVDFNQMLKTYIDGIPLDFASSLLPFKTRFNSLFIHIHLHSNQQKKYESTHKKVEIKGSKQLSKMGLLAILDNLESITKKLEWKPFGTEWGEYYNNTNYISDAFESKKNLIKKYIDKIKPNTIVDIGANTGLYSRIAGNNNIDVLSIDIDPAAVEKNYLDVIKNKETNILPLIMDINNPSPGVGWGNNERMSFLERCPVDTILALALIHHLAISNNVPLNKVAKLFSKICKWLIIEFVPKSDSQVKKLLSTREDIFPNYNKENFENVFEKYFTQEMSYKVENSERTLYLFKKKN